MDAASLSVSSRVPCGALRTSSAPLLYFGSLSIWSPPVTLRYTNNRQTRNSYKREIRRALFNVL